MLTNFKYGRSRLLRRALQVLEDKTVFGSDIVITICQDLYDHVHAMGAGHRSVLIENVMGGDVEEPPRLTAAAVRGTPAEAAESAFQREIGPAPTGGESAANLDSSGVLPTTVLS